MPSTPANIGFAVQITREDKTSFLAITGTGNVPAVFFKNNRKYAVEFKKALKAANLNAKVVKVSYSDPIVVR